MRRPPPVDRRLRLLLPLALLGAIGCEGGDGSDAGPPREDAGLDAGAPRDASAAPDAGTPRDDAATPSDSGPPDASSAQDAGAPTNPDVTLIRELTFEQPDGTNGWSDPASVIFHWGMHSTGRDRVPDAFVRGAGGINIPDLVDAVAYRGERSVMFTMQPWGSGETFRTDLEMVGDTTADPPLTRLFHQGETHLVGFAMRIEHATVEQGSGGFQLMMQYHNGNPPRAGYGTTRNPALSLLRSGNDDLTVALRDNRPGDERLSTFESIPGGVRAGQWVRWVFKTRFANYDSGENGLVEVWSATGDEPLQMHFRVDDRPLGYAYENPAHEYEVIIFDLYGAPLQEDGRVYVDEIRIAEGDLDPSVVDPASWSSYQHPLNAAYDADLAAPRP